MRNVITQYYIVQFVTWGLVAFQQILISIVFNDFRISRSLFLIFLSLCGFLLTHTYRLYALRRQVFDKSLAYQMRIGLTYSLFYSFLLGFVSYYGAVLFLLNKKVVLPDLRFLSIVLNFWIIIGAWLFLYHLYQYFQKLLQKSEQKWQLQKNLQETESELLQLQINPHFLFNALNAIRALILTSPTQAQQGINMLRKLLVEGYAKVGFGIISLKQELAIVEQYLTLECLRFGEKINFQIDKPDEVSDWAIPAGIMLTLAENAVKHGGKQRVLTNAITLHTQATAQQLHIQVSNTGIFKENNNQLIGGIGLQNLEKRLRIYAQNQFNLTIKNIDNERVSITVSLPLVAFK